MFSSIFRRSSKTYFYSSLFFPPHVRHDVTTLYEFVRLADNYVDSIPQDDRGFETFCEFYRSELPSPHHAARTNTAEYQKVTTHFITLMHAKQFEPAWIEAFIDAMRSDLDWPKDNLGKPMSKYKTYVDLQKYMYGSAGVVGLMMAKILNLPEKSHQAAVLQGEAMQLINFVRDIAEDLTLGRVYLPQEDLKRFGVDSSVLLSCHPRSLSRHPELDSGSRGFCDLVRFEIDRYRQIQSEAEKGYSLIPRRYRIAVKTAADMYRWTANKIYDDPTIVWREKVKPKKRSIFLDALTNFLSIA